MITSLESRVAAAVIVSLLAGGACTSAPVHGPGQGAALSRSIALRVHGHRYAGTKDAVDLATSARLVSGATVRSGEPFDLEIVLDRAAYVQIAHVRPDGRAALLPLGAQPLPPGTHRIPEDEDAHLRFGDLAGRETFYVVASSTPLEAADPALARALAAMRGADGNEKLAIQYVPPGDGGAAKEGLAFQARGVITRKLRGELLAAHSDDAGVAAFRFELEHVGTAP